MGVTVAILSEQWYDAKRKTFLIQTSNPSEAQKNYI
jgi:hypothetical protein